MSRAPKAWSPARLEVLARGDPSAPAEHGEDGRDDGGDREHARRGRTRDERPVERKQAKPGHRGGAGERGGVEGRRRQPRAPERRRRREESPAAGRGERPARPDLSAARERGAAREERDRERRSEVEREREQGDGPERDEDREEREGRMPLLARVGPRPCEEARDDDAEEQREQGRSGEAVLGEQLERVLVGVVRVAVQRVRPDRMAGLVAVVQRVLDLPVARPDAEQERATGPPARPSSIPWVFAQSTFRSWIVSRAGSAGRNSDRTRSRARSAGRLPCPAPRSATTRPTPPRRVPPRKRPARRAAGRDGPPAPG